MMSAKDRRARFAKRIEEAGPLPTTIMTGNMDAEDIHTATAKAMIPDLEMEEALTAREVARMRHDIFVSKMLPKGFQISDGGTLFLKTVGHDNYIIELKIETPLRRVEERETNFYAAVGYLQGLLHEVVSARADISHSVEKEKKGIK